MPDEINELLVGQVKINGGQQQVVDRDIVISWNSSEDKPLDGEAKIFFHTSPKGKPTLKFS